MRVELHPEADRELSEILRYLGEISETLALTFESDLRSALSRLAVLPGLGAPLGGGAPARYRRYVIRRHGYSIIYIELKQTIQVVAIAHARRRPGYWMRR